MKTNKGLVEHAKMMMAAKAGYVWGTFGGVLTEGVLQQKLKQYPDGVGQYEDFIRAHWMGRKTTDCIGLIKGYVWTGDDGKIHYDGKTDVDANSILKIAKEKGPISTMPDVPGICVQKQGHIGVYIGNGQVIEAHGTKYGVIKTPMKGPGSTPWTNWLKCPFITYEAEMQTVNPVALPTIKLGMQGEAVKQLQTALVKRGYNIVQDGIFGATTDAAVKLWQKKNGLTVDGIVGPKTWATIK